MLYNLLHVGHYVSSESHDDLTRAESTMLDDFAIHNKFVYESLFLG